jgi:hypothetical protein
LEKAFQPRFVGVVGVGFILGIIARRVDIDVKRAVTSPRQRREIYPSQDKNA